MHVAYQTSGNIAVLDDIVLQTLDTARECGFVDRYNEVQEIINNKKKGEAEPIELRRLKGSIRRAEAKAACRQMGLTDPSHVHFLNLPFYETGGVKKGLLTDKDIQIVVDLLREIKPHQIYAAGDLSDPHGTHRVCIEAVLAAMEVVQDEEWVKECRLWLYRGAWQEWDLDMVDMAVPLSPDEVIQKRHAIYRHLSQKDIGPVPRRGQARILATGRGTEPEHRQAVRQARNGRISSHRSVCQAILTIRTNTGLNIAMNKCNGRSITASRIQNRQKSGASDCENPS